MWTYTKKMIENSIKKVLAYPFEVWMLLIYSLFELSFILLFWWSISSNFILPDGYVQGDMFVFSAMLMVSSGFQEIFFGINVLPYDINDGNLDNYIIKPKNMWIHYMLDTMNVPIILEKQIIGLIAFIVSVYCFAIDVNIVRTILAFVLLFFANLILNY